MEVLKAARDESRTALLVYASERAVKYESEDLPPQLRVSIFRNTYYGHQQISTPRLLLTSKQNFVRADNLAFAAELEDLSAPKPTTPTKRKAIDDAENDDEDEQPNWGGYQDSYISASHIKATEASIPDSADPTLPPYTPASTSPPRTLPMNTGRASLGKKTNPASYDDRIPTSLRATRPTLDPTSMALDEHPDISLMDAGQEMQQRGALPTLVPRGSTGRIGVYNPNNYPTEISMEDGEGEDLEARHVEFAEGRAAGK